MPFQHESIKTGIIVFNGKRTTTGIPRSLASDGRWSVLVLHVLVHAAGLAFNVAACIHMWQTAPEVKAQVGVTVAVAMHGIGIGALLTLAASEIKQLAFVVSMSFIYAFLLTAIFATAVMLTSTLEASDSKYTTPHWLYYGSLFLQATGLSMLTANALNIAAHHDEAFDPEPEIVAL